MLAKIKCNIKVGIWLCVAVKQIGAVYLFCFCFRDGIEIKLFYLQKFFVFEKQFELESELFNIDIPFLRPALWTHCCKCRISFFVTGPNVWRTIPFGGPLLLPTNIQRSVCLRLNLMVTV